MGSDMFLFMRDNPNYGKELVSGEEMYINFKYRVSEDLHVDLNEWKDLSPDEKGVWNKMAKFYHIYM